NRHLILEIKVLLESTQLSVQEIAHRLNFPDQSYLGCYFKRYTGKSPSEYRNLLDNYRFIPKPAEKGFVDYYTYF
ncbi:MAG: helix-turn-helix domain-containing protein, partial [Tannerellaceae bacterium]|nr:helix-turn-helix domain-containing protein [Tannerellaceae bacterium]